MSQSNLYVIVGLGITGMSCARYLERQNIPYAMMDTRDNPPQLKVFQDTFPNAPLYLGGLDSSVLEKAANIILSPGIPLNEPTIAAQIRSGRSVIGDIELFARAVKAPVIAITGTNAKSTVTTLVGEMLRAAGYQVQVGGNLGIPALDLLEGNPQADVFVLELSSFQLETTYSLTSKVATVLNITPDHMDRYASVADYQRAKHRIYKHCELAVCNRDDPLTETVLAPKIHFTLETPSQQEVGLLKSQGEIYLAFETTRLLSVKRLPIIGKHYQANALAALAIGYGFGLSFAVMLDVLGKFKGLPHRCQWVRERQGIAWYNDSKGTNVGATQAAIEGLGCMIEGKLILIAGGLGKNADFHSLVPNIKKYVRHAVLMGKAANDIAQAIDGGVPISFAENMQEAVHIANEKASAGDSILLSPACASFDMFKHFEHRGEVFMEIVQKL